LRWKNGELPTSDPIHQLEGCARGRNSRLQQQ
jgi:hypothetical protein